MDPGSDRSYITTSLVKRLGLKSYDRSGVSNAALVMLNDNQVFGVLYGQYSCPRWIQYTC